MTMRAKQAELFIVCLKGLVVTALIAMPVANAFAAKVILKDGKVVEGPIIKVEEQSIKVQEYLTKRITEIKDWEILEVQYGPQEPKVTGNKYDKKPEPASVGSIQPMLGLYANVGLPLGSIASKASIGFGGLIWLDIRMPLPEMTFNMYLGFTTGFLYYGTSSSQVPSFMMIPALVHTKLLFNVEVPQKLWVRPYLKLAGGVTPVMGGGLTSIDPTFYGALGVGFIPAKLPKLELSLEVGAMMAFEKTTGIFMMVNVGVAYRFGVQPATESDNIIIKK